MKQNELLAWLDPDPGVRLARMLWQCPRDDPRMLRTLAGHTGAITDCVISRDGKRAISAGWDHSVRVWDLVNGRPLHALHGHQGAVSALCLLPDDQHVVSGSWDHSLIIWVPEFTIPAER